MYVYTCKQTYNKIVCAFIKTAGIVLSQICAYLIFQEDDPQQRKFTRIVSISFQAGLSYTGDQTCMLNEGTMFALRYCVEMRNRGNFSA